VEGWSFVQTLGEGTYGEVKLVVKNGMGMTEAVAVKIVDLKKAKLSLNLIKKEIAIHKMLHHENVIKFYGTRKEADYQYMFLAYASGGELFDRIEPDVGMPQQQAQCFFRQLINGVEYLHSLGITHRDIKPENILLDDKDVLKIVDFGFATLFRHKGKERLVDNSCGTPPYVAPEVMLDKPYHAEPADIWSCAIVLVAMLAGELPWDSPNLDCDEFVNWLEHNIQFSPWTKIGTMPLALLRKLLAESPRDRYSIAAIKKDRWFMKQLQQKRRLSSPVSSPFTKRAMSGYKNITFNPVNSALNDPFSASQPEPWLVDADVSEESVGNLLHIGLSQPAESTTMLISTQCLSTPCSSQTALQRLVKRMTRFWSCKNTFNTMTEIKEVCGKLDYSVKQTSSMELTVTTKDRRLRRLVFKIGNVKTTTHRTLVDVRMSQGDGLEFKRRYDELNKRLANLVLGQTLTGSIP
uniref:Serine/threonine-protein kinase Chk1 n=1 Tax=Ciona savignyi TaxID=51511 RepID=H2Y7A8_CIOSA